MHKSHGDINMPNIAGLLVVKAVKGAGTNIIAQLISLIANIFGVIILARILQPKDFGIVTMVSTFYLLLTNFGENGFSEYIIQKQTINQSELNNIFWMHGVLSFSLMLIFMSMAPILALFYNEPLITPVSVVMAFGIIVQMLSTVHVAILKRNMEFSKVAINGVVSGAIGLMLAIVMAMTGAGYWAVVARQLSIPLVMAIGAWVVCPWRPGLPGRMKGAIGSFRYVLHVYGNFCLNHFARSLDKILLGKFHGAQILGIYDRAYYLSNMPSEQLLAPLHSVALATLSRLREDNESFCNYFKKAISTLAFLGVLAGLILTIAGKDLIYVLLGPEWEQSGVVVVAFGPGIGAMFIYTTHSWIHLSLGKPERWLRWSLVSSLVTGGLSLIFAPFGPVALASALSLSFYVLLFPSLWYAGRPIGLKVIPICKAIGPFFGSGIGTWLIWAGSFNLITTTSNFLIELNIFLRLFLEISISTFMYVTLVIAFHRGLGPIMEIVNLGRTFFSREEAPVSLDMDFP
jgi:O-antigen/teichoic acid export membrane protein